MDIPSHGSTLSVLKFLLGLQVPTGERLKDAELILVAIVLNLAYAEFCCADCLPSCLIWISWQGN